MNLASILFISEPGINFIPGFGGGVRELSG